MGGIIRNIQQTTKEMSGKEKLEYILTYYWYHILGILVAVGLVVFGIVHFAFPEKKPLFTCAFVNQKVDSARDTELAEQFADNSQIEKDRVRFDSDYLISYEKEDTELESGETQAADQESDAAAGSDEAELKKDSSNESGFDKFFFQWSGGELDAVVMTEDFLSYCIEVGGEFHSVDQFDTQGLQLTEVDGVKAVKLEGTKLEQYLDGTEKKDLVLVFPETADHTENCQKFLDFIK